MNKTYGYYKVASCTFPISIGNVDKNAKEIIRHIKEAENKHVQLIVFSELCVTGYTCADMFSHEALSKASEKALNDILQKTEHDKVLACIGMPVEQAGKLFNCAVYIKEGNIVGVVPKTYIPNYAEFYEKRWFVSSSCRTSDSITLCGKEVPFSENLILRGDDHIAIATEICEDLWVDSPPSGILSRAGATIIVNPSASNDVIAKREYRRNLVVMQSGRCRAGYVYSSSGAGESSTDLVFSGHCMIADNGHMVNEITDLMVEDEMITGVIDVERCINDRRKYNSDLWGKAPEVLEVKISTTSDTVSLPDYVNPYPFVPSDERKLKQRCDEILTLQSKGLMQRLRATGIKSVTIGISGGLDSTLALLVCCKAFDSLKLDRKGIIAITMPGFGTSDKTKGLATTLMKELDVTYKTIDIKKACIQHLKDLGHPEDVYDITYENTQARERTQILFDHANMTGGLVIGTGDMSEAALGWCTYNGDHMSNYAVNIGVPKTLVKYLVRAYAMDSDDKLKNTLMDIFDLPISPELLPTDSDGNIAQKTEESIGKYDLHDFFLYHYLRNGFGKDKLYILAKIAFPKVSEEEISTTLDTFYKRFRTQQFKRSCMPDGVKIGSVALSPRGDLRLPSDLSELY
ncbi:MAG: NAD(+) synthase [Erysipelotrichaceae bacterium]|nr:NAD(+) synthase [Erysipelotrichaceae bacterium]